MNQPIRIFVMPGGEMPRRQSEFAVGFDAHLRALVSPTEMDRDSPQFRKTLFDFLTLPSDPAVAQHVVVMSAESSQRKLVYRLQPGDLVLGGIGIVTELPFPLFMGIWPRSGLLIRNRIDISNAPGTVDSDYRGEAGVLIENKGSQPFDLHRGMRLAQLIFQPAVIPDFTQVNDLSLLGETKRNAAGFGSTGLT